MSPLEHCPNDGCPARSQLLRPAKRDQVDLRVLRSTKDLLFAPADSDLETNLVEAPGAVAGEKFLRPCGGLVLRLVGESGHGVLVVDMDHDDLELGSTRELEDRLRRE